MILETVYIMTVLIKSNTESINDVSNDREDEVSVTMILAASNNTFAPKLMKIAKVTTRTLYRLWDGDFRSEIAELILRQRLSALRSTCEFPVDRTCSKMTARLDLDRGTRLAPVHICESIVPLGNPFSFFGIKEHVPFLPQDTIRLIRSCG
jgi:hypothetical protein